MNTDHHHHHTTATLAHDNTHPMHEDSGIAPDHRHAVKIGRGLSKRQIVFGPAIHLHAHDDPYTLALDPINQGGTPPDKKRGTR